jgi:hypothetical protein
MEKDASNMEKLQMDEFGNISNWPPDFFGDELGDSYALLQAEMNRTSSPVSPGFASPGQRMVAIQN